MRKDAAVAPPEVAGGENEDMRTLGVAAAGKADMFGENKMEIAQWEAHTKGLGSKLLKAMGYMVGQPLGCAQSRAHTCHHTSTPADRADRGHGPGSSMDNPERSRLCLAEPIQIRVLPPGRSLDFISVRPRSERTPRLPQGHRSSILPRQTAGVSVADRCQRSRQHQVAAWGLSAAERCATTAVSAGEEEEEGQNASQVQRRPDGRRHV
jgi:hypothetical protein